VIRTEDSAFIPNDPDNLDWVRYQEWLEKGGTPAAYVAPPSPGPTTEQLLLETIAELLLRVSKLEGK
jgi:hypothetical protein